jgi:uncharacterized membrane protein (GlpM family)
LIVNAAVAASVTLAALTATLMPSSFGCDAALCRVAFSLSAMVTKAVLSGLIVFMILRAVGRLGDRVSGMVSGLPYTSAMALLWIAQERGAAAMAATVTDAMVTASAYALFAVFFLGFTHFWRARVALPLAALGALALVHLLHAAFAFSEPSAGALVVCGGLLWGARLLLPQTDTTDTTGAIGAHGPAHVAPGETKTTFTVTQRHLLAAFYSALLVLMLLVVGQAASRWVAAALVGLPVVSGVVLAFAHQSGSHSKTLRTAEGFIDGCLIRTCFCFFFAMLLPVVGVLGAFSSAVALSLALAGSLFWRARMLSQSHALESRQALTTVWIKRPR